MLKDHATLAAGSFESSLEQRGLAPLRRRAVTTLQINVGRLCDLACHHCHVEAGPTRTENMSFRTAERVLELLEASPGIGLVDLTGGAPELNPNFRFLVRGARALGRHVIDRCNLTVLFLPGQEDLAEFLAEHDVAVAASLPCYTQENVEKQRGRGVFAKSIDGLKLLNRLGYGRSGSPLELDLIYNPLDASLPAPQAELEERYRKELAELFGIEFTRLFAITNMPIKRFAHDLARQGKQEEYLSLLMNSFNPEAVSGLMCRDLVSVAWDGTLHDCDFNQMLDIPLGGRPRSVWDVGDLASIDRDPIATDRHCFGCTAGAGSSCGGALT